MTALGCTGTLYWRSMMMGGIIRFLPEKPCAVDSQLVVDEGEQHFSTEWCTVQNLNPRWNLGVLSSLGHIIISTSLEAKISWGWTLLSTFSNSGMEGVSGLLWQLPEILSAPGLMPSLLFSALIGNVGSWDGKQWSGIWSTEVIDLVIIILNLDLLGVLDFSVCLWF